MSLTVHSKRQLRRPGSGASAKCDFLADLNHAPLDIYTLDEDEYPLLVKSLSLLCPRAVLKVARLASIALCLPRPRLLIRACSTGILRIRSHALVSTRPRLHCECGGNVLATRAHRSDVLWPKLSQEGTPLRRPQQSARFAFVST